MNFHKNKNLHGINKTYNNFIQKVINDNIAPFGEIYAKRIDNDFKSEIEGNRKREEKPVT